MKKLLAVCTIAIASISAMAQTPRATLGLSTDQQRALANLSTDQKKELAESVVATMNHIDPNECPADNVLIALFCKASAKKNAEGDAEDLAALVTEPGKTAIKASTDDILKRRDADITALEARINKMSEDELKSQTESAKNTIALAQNIVNNITDQPSFDSAYDNLIKMGLAPNGSKPTVYSPELIDQLKKGLAFSASKFDEALTEINKPWWERWKWWLTPALIAFVRSLQSARDKRAIRERQAYFSANAHLFGLNPADYGAQFSISGTIYTLGGIDRGMVFAIAGKKLHRIDPQIVRNALALKPMQEPA